MCRTGISLCLFLLFSLSTLHRLSTSSRKKRECIFWHEANHFSFIVPNISRCITCHIYTIIISRSQHVLKSCWALSTRAYCHIVQGLYEWGYLAILKLCAANKKSFGLYVCNGKISNFNKNTNRSDPHLFLFFKKSFFPLFYSISQFYYSIINITKHK